VRLEERPEREGDADATPCTFLQSEFWAVFKASSGWNTRRFLAEREGTAFPILMMERRVSKLFRFAYVPRAPIPPEALSETAEALSRRMRADCAFIRFDLALPDKALAGNGSYDPGRPFRKAIADVQPPDTVIIDVGAGEEAVLSGMKPKWRYNVRLAAKKGVSVSFLNAKRADEIELESALSRFYAIYRETATRDGISLHREGYYRRLFALARERDDAPDIRIWTASVEGRPVAMNITLFSGEEAVYLYGASSNEKREYMPTYALQWEAMRESIRSGCKRYDLFGIPPSGDEAHPMHGLYRMKTGFGGRIVHAPGCYDLPLKKLAYACFRGAESLRSYYHKVLKKSGKREGDGRSTDRGPRHQDAKGVSPSPKTIASNTESSVP
jgi:lipid II:glycine glycyltransferase (peptidoglycan interpeptide bridge formation enzyme)